MLKVLQVTSEDKSQEKMAESVIMKREVSARHIQRECDKVYQRTYVNEVENSICTGLGHNF